MLVNNKRLYDAMKEAGFVAPSEDVLSSGVGITAYESFMLVVHGFTPEQAHTFIAHPETLVADHPLQSLVEGSKPVAQAAATQAQVVQATAPTQAQVVQAPASTTQAPATPAQPKPAESKGDTKE
jgi:hypothetical protein